MIRRQESPVLFKSFNTLWYNCSLADISVSQNLSITLPLFKDPPLFSCTEDEYRITINVQGGSVISGTLSKLHRGITICLFK